MEDPKKITLTEEEKETYKYFINSPHFIECNEYSKQLNIIYFEAFKNFISLIPENYKYFNNLLFLTYKAKDKIQRSAPEIIDQNYQSATMLMISYMPVDNNEWNEVAWSYILNGAKEANQAKKEFNN